MNVFPLQSCCCAHGAAVAGAARSGGCAAVDIAAARRPACSTPKQPTVATPAAIATVDAWRCRHRRSVAGVRRSSARTGDSILNTRRRSRGERFFIGRVHRLMRAGRSLHRCDTMFDVAPRSARGSFVGGWTSRVEGPTAGLRARTATTKTSLFATHGRATRSDRRTAREQASMPGRGRCMPRRHRCMRREHRHTAAGQRSSGGRSPGLPARVSPRHGVGAVFLLLRAKRRPRSSRLSSSAPLARLCSLAYW